MVTLDWNLITLTSLLSFQKLLFHFICLIIRIWRDAAVRWEQGRILDRGQLVVEVHFLQKCGSKWSAPCRVITTDQSEPSAFHPSSGWFPERSIDHYLALPGRKRETSAVNFRPTFSCFRLLIIIRCEILILAYIFHTYVTFKQNH